jgi:dynein heavy chain, axonemal
LLQRETENIPDSAAELYKQNDTLLNYVANLDLTVSWYNKIRETVLEVEYPIIEGQLQIIDTQLQQAEGELNWTIDG